MLKIRCGNIGIRAAKLLLKAALNETPASTGKGKTQMTITRILSFGMAVLGVTVTGAFAQNSANRVTESGNLNANERTFVQNMARGNIAEIELGKLAQQKGANSTVRDFGAQMVRDHTMLNNQLKQWAQQNRISFSLPIAPSAAQTAQKQRLMGMSGQAFDRAYMEAMLNDHQHDVMETENMANSAENPQVRQLAQQALPVLQEHLKIAQQNAATLGISVPNERSRSANQ